MLLDQAAQRPRVFQRHGRALGEVGAQRVRGVAQQGHPASRMLLRAGDGRAVVERPQRPARHHIDHLQQIGVGRAQRASQVVGVGFVGPALRIGTHRAAMALPEHAMHDDDDVEPPALAHRVMHHMQPRPQPGGHQRRAQRSGQVGTAHHAAVGQMAAGAYRLRTQQLAAHAAPQTVGADQRAGVEHRFVFPGHAHAIGALGVAGHAGVERQMHLGQLAHRLQQQRVQIGPVQRGVGLAVASPHR